MAILLFKNAKNIPLYKSKMTRNYTISAHESAEKTI